MKTYKTIAILEEIVIPLTNKTRLLRSQRKFRSGVRMGKVLYLIKFSKPDFANLIIKIANVINRLTKLQFLPE